MMSYKCPCQGGWPTRGQVTPVISQGQLGEVIKNVIALAVKLRSGEDSQKGVRKAGQAQKFHHHFPQSCSKKKLL